MTALGQYELLLRLGAGGAANVFLVRDTKHEGKLEALKVLLPELAADREALAMFFTEARIATKLRHPNIVGVTGFGRVDGIHCLAMDYVFGQSLGDVLAESARTHRPLTVGVLLNIISSVCGALHYAHELRDKRGEPMGIVHRDVTAQNIMIAFDGVPKLADFGIAKAVDRGFETKVGVVKGKFAYMSPEQAMGKRVDRRSDIFCMGIVLWEALTGEVLFEGATPFDSLALIRDKPIPPPSEIAPGLSPLVDPIIMRALQRAPQARYQTAAEMKHDLDELVKSAGVTIDANTLSMELAGIYGAAIPERAFALKAAMAGEGTSAMLATALGGVPLSRSQLPVVPGGTSDPDPLGLFSSTQRPSSRGRSPTMRARPDRAFSVAQRPVITDEHQTLDGAASPAQLRALDALEADPRPQLDPAESFDSWDQHSRRHDRPDRLLSLISDRDARERTIPPEFKQHFGGALEVSELTPLSDVSDYDDEEDDEEKTLTATPRYHSSPQVAVIPVSPSQVAAPSVRRSPHQLDSTEQETLRGDSISPFRQDPVPLISEPPTIDEPMPVPIEDEPDTKPTLRAEPARARQHKAAPKSAPVHPPAEPQDGLRLKTSTLVLIALGSMALGAAGALAFIVFYLER